MDEDSQRPNTNRKKVCAMKISTATGLTSKTSELCPSALPAFHGSLEPQTQIPNCPQLLYLTFLTNFNPQTSGFSETVPLKFEISGHSDLGNSAFRETSRGRTAKIEKSRAFIVPRPASVSS